MHPRNRHQARYDFESLIRSSPELAAFVRANPYGDDSIDFAEPAAVTALNRALLQHFYGITHWQIPSGYLCPPIPGRADYLHHVADLLAQSHGGSIPRGTSCAILDIGVGANCIYPIIGVKEYGWRFVGSDIDSVALASARTIVAANPSLADHVECRLQKSADAIFQAVVRPDEVFDVSICNPPFHASAQEAAAGTRRKVRNLAGHRDPAPSLNFGGRSHELWCRGGEAVFVRHMIAESAQRPALCRWFSTLVSKSENLPRIRQALQAAGAVEVRTIEMAQGQKKSRMVAWTFLGPAQRGRHRSNRGTGP